MGAMSSCPFFCLTTEVFNEPQVKIRLEVSPETAVLAFRADMFTASQREADKILQISDSSQDKKATPIVMAVSKN